jgi:kumamolisin
MKLTSKTQSGTFRGAHLVLALVASALTHAAVAAAPQLKPLDNGAAAPGTVESVSIVLKVRNAEALDEFIANSVNPESPRYHKFLTTAQFRAQFAPTDATVARVSDYLRKLGISVDEIYPNNLLIKATGTVAQLNKAFSTSIHEYVDDRGRHFRKPSDDNDHTPASLADVVLYVGGLNTQAAQYRPKKQTAATTGRGLQETVPAVVLPSGNQTATGVPGSFTTGDVANLYGVNPLYAKGITGRGRTVGIATLANFDPADAYSYWDGIGLPVDHTRIRQVHVDGGGDLSADAGSGETALDVEQSGGLAPDAKVIVYDAPNTEAGFIDVFHRAIAENKVDTLSVSWGSPEIFNYAIPSVSTDTRAVLVAYHQVFAEAAAQGISLFAAAGDSGAYDTDRSLPYPKFSKILTVDAPASDPYITAAGGTTVAAAIQRKYGVVTVPKEQVWGWDYFNDYLVTNYGPDFKDLYFAVGGGGGVSVFWKKPYYQEETPGIRRSEPNQVWTYTPNYPDTTGQVTLYTVPANVAGRNVPDISLNSDPYTGYLVYSTPDGGWIAGYGGTSFAAPQLNGIASLLSQASGSRLGLLNPQLYALKSKSAGKTNGIVDIAAGDNWFYSGVPGYEPGAGLGAINAARLSERIR